MNKRRIAFEYLRYYFGAKTKYSIHSPFGYQFVTKLFHHKPVTIELLNQIETLRKTLLASKATIQTTDFGAGKVSSKTKRISDIVKHAAQKKKYALLLHKITSYYKLQNILELGTSAGISTMYMAAASNECRIITIEGCPETAKLANENFLALQIKNITQLTGNFDELLPAVLKKYAPFDLVFFDGNHQFEATMNYFEQCLNYINNNTIFIFDDINWSNGMKLSWQQIKHHPSVKVTFDLFFLGIVFFRKELSKENIIIRY